MNRLLGRSSLFCSLFLACAVAPAAFAQSAADALMQSAADALMQAAGPIAAPQAGAQGAAVAAPTVVDASMFGQEEIKLNTPIARQLFAEWNSSRGSNAAFETGTWMRFFLAEKFEAAAHLWSAISNKLPDNMATLAKSAHLYSLYRLGLNQTFFDQWMAALGTKSFADSKGASALEESIAPDFDAWFLNHAVQISTDQAATIRNLGPQRSAVLTSLTAAILERKGLDANDLLAKLPLNSLFRPRLAQTVAVAFARKNDLAGAGRALKTFYEPWLLAKGSPRDVSAHYLQVARLLYQAGAFDGAISYYEKIPNGSPDYLTAREELTWCWLRKGDSERLRGNLKTLTSKVLEDKFQPEAYLVRAVSNLKLCYHNEVENDFTAFLAANRVWASKIQKNMKNEDPDAPRSLDAYSARAVNAEKERSTEIATLKALAERSIAAVLPAVGPQKHWTDALQKATQNLEMAKKARVTEFRRQWKNDQATLIEAIRKMQFVKVELLSQVAVLAAQNPIGNGAETRVAALESASGAKIDNDAAKAKIRNDGDMVFPFDGVVWPDELFKLRSQTTSQCLGHL